MSSAAATPGPADQRTARPRGPWNPGIESQLPAEFLPLATLFRHENTTTPVREALELADFCGLPAHELTRLRPSRLVVHELLIRVMADLSVPDGRKYEDLGINSRRMTRTLLDTYLSPHSSEFEAAHEALLTRARATVEAEVARLSPPPRPPEPEPARGLLAFLRRKPEPPPRAPSESAEEREARVLGAWHAEAQSNDDAEMRAIYAALARAGGAIHRRRGRITGSASLIATIAVTLIGNDHGSELIGRLIEPHVAEGIALEGYRLLPAQAHPVVMNVKGASASGKSTMRPEQRRLAQRLGVAWEDFALISPDIWRKFLLDYSSIGRATGYAGTLTGHEVAVIDKKLDRYMARKGESGRMSHLLIDRFRFDSFSAGPEREDGSRLLTRFGHIVYLSFMITPPEATVERAFLRGEQFGRYKAVDDLLDHNIEAYNGIPRLFFTWANRNEKQVHFEFLDNSVPLGTTPRTIAFGWNGEINVLDVGMMLDIDRYAKVNIDATAPDEVYPKGDAMAAVNNTGFLRECARQMPVMSFASADTGRVYARLDHGRLAWWDRDELARALRDPQTRAGLEAVIDAIPASDSPPPAPPVLLEHSLLLTLGRWGEATTPPEKPVLSPDVTD